MAPTAQGQSSNQPLPPKQHGLFKKIVKSYESKQYRFGLKYANTILSNPEFATHGETLAMKGLILTCMGKKEEGMDAVKLGLTKDLRSYVCWHVYGLVNRSDKKYDEAVKAYKQAMKIDKDNMQILRDLSLLQIQIRDYEGYKESRYHLLRLRPNMKMNWIGYASAYHLLKDHDKALEIISEFISSNKPTGYDYDHSELLLYQNMVLRESGQVQAALDKLEEGCAQIYDKVLYMETRGDLLMTLDRMHDAERVWRQLIKRNPENILYYNKLEECLGLGEGADTTKILALYDELADQFKRASAPRRQPLYFAEGDELRKRLIEWVLSGLRKGVPSLFKNLVPLYNYPDKVSLIESILLDFVKKVENQGYKASLDGLADLCESPTTSLWLYLLVAQHYDRTRQTVLAMKFVDQALLHTPTLIETLMIKAKIYKHAGDFTEAARLMDEAQSLDTADRYINSKCAKYLLRAGLIDEAEKMCAKFTREGERASVCLNDMQCFWWELESARAYRQLNKFGEALRKAHQIEQHFVGMVEDQFDFHTYCLRKMTLTSYISLLRLEDVLRKHEYYYQTAKLAVKIYLRMLDRPHDMDEKGIADDGLSATERKRLKKKLKKEKEKEEEESRKSSKKEMNPAMLFDPEALLKPACPLEEAAKFVQHLHLLGSKHITAFTLGFEVYLRKGKPLLMLKCLREANKIDPNDPVLHVCRVKFLKYLVTAHNSGIVADLVDEMTSNLFGVRDPLHLNEEFKQFNIGSLPHRMAVAECNVLLDDSNHVSTSNWLLKSIEDDKLTGRNLDILTKLRDGIHYGRYGKWSKEEIDTFVRLGRQMYPFAQVFGGGSAKVYSNKVVEIDENGHHSFE